MKLIDNDPLFFGIATIGFVGLWAMAWANYGHRMAFVVSSLAIGACIVVLAAAGGKKHAYPVFTQSE